MKLLTAPLAIFVSTATASFGVGFGLSSSGSQAPLADNEYKVPGDNPLYFCEDPKDYLLDITKVDLDPNPPKAGQALSIAASGNVTQKIEEGAKVHLEVKYGLITLIRQDADLCEYVDNVDLSCPIKEGTLDLSKDVDIPNEVPPGTYTVLANVYTKPDDDNKSDKITCLTAKVAFSRH